MADDKIEFELVSPERLLLSEPVEMVVVPGTEGDFGVLPRHTPMISTVRPGIMRVFEKGSVKETIFLTGGFAEVTPERCTVLADQAMTLNEIDRVRAEQQLNDAREDLADAKDEDERRVAQKTIAIAEAMLQASQG